MSQSVFNSWPHDWTDRERLQWGNVAHQCVAASKNGQVVVLATGVFDIFHMEHRRFLEKAKAAGDFLVVGVECDSRVSQMKGANRPINSQNVRLTQVKSTSVVDAAAVLPQAFTKPEHYLALLQLLHPDILAVSSHSPHQDRKAALMAKVGGKLLVVHEHNPAISTTQLLQSSAIID